MLNKYLMLLACLATTFFVNFLDAQQSRNYGGNFVPLWQQFGNVDPYFRPMHNHCGGPFCHGLPLNSHLSVGSQPILGALNNENGGIGLMGSVIESNSVADPTNRKSASEATVDESLLDNQDSPSDVTMNNQQNEQQPELELELMKSALQAAESESKLQLERLESRLRKSAEKLIELERQNAELNDQLKVVKLRASQKKKQLAEELKLSQDARAESEKTLRRIAEKSKQMVAENRKKANAEKNELTNRLRAVEAKLRALTEKQEKEASKKNRESENNNAEMSKQLNRALEKIRNRFNAKIERAKGTENEKATIERLKKEMAVQLDKMEDRIRNRFKNRK